MSRSIHNLLQFALILESGKRRKPWERKALVSKPFPYVFQDYCTMLISPPIAVGEFPFVKDAAAMLIPPVSECIIEDFDPFRYYTQEEPIAMLIPQVTTCVIETSDPFVRVSQEEPMAMLIPDIKSLTISDARVDYEQAEEIGMLIPTITSCTITNV